MKGSEWCFLHRIIVCTTDDPLIVGSKSYDRYASHLLDIEEGSLADNLRASLMAYMIEHISDLNALLGPNPVTLLPCAVESHLTPGDSRGSSSPCRSISGVSSHVADGGSARVPHECVQPSLSRSSSPSRSIHSPEHHVIFHPSCSHHVPKVA